MISTVTLTANITTKTGRVTDSTDYLALNINVSTLQAKALASIKFQGDIIVQLNTVGSPLIDLASGATYYEFPLELDSTGAVANGVYEISGYQVAIVQEATTIAADENVFFLGAADTSVSITADDTIVIPSGTNAGTFTILQAGYASGYLILLVEEDTTAESPISINCTIYLNPTLAATSFTYSGCTLIEACVTLTSDCAYGDNGTWSVSNDTDITTETLVSLSATINYPSWTGEAAIVVTSLPYVNNRLATGTYSVVLSEVISTTQSDGLILQYTATVTSEFTVRCAQPLCNLNKCIENLRAANAGALNSSQVSQYQVYVDNVNLYWIQAQNYLACGDLTEYTATVALIEAQLDASGCDCGCCDDDDLRWVYNTSESAQTAIELLQTEVLALENPTVYDYGIYYSQLPFSDDSGYYLPTVDFTRPFTDISAVTIDKKYFTVSPNGYAKQFVEIEFSSYTRNNTQANITIVGGDVIYSAPTNAFVEVTTRHKVVLTTMLVSGVVIMMVHSQAWFIDNDDNAANWIPYAQLYSSSFWDLSEDLVLDFTPLISPTTITYTDFKITAIAVP